MEDEKATLVAQINELWPDIFIDENVDAINEVIDKAYSVQVVPETRTVTLGFAYDDDEVYAAFKDGADAVGVFAPDIVNVTCTILTKGCIVYIEMQWEE